MKKFMKVCAITALVLLVVGLLFALVAGSIQGRNAISEIVDTVTGGKVQLNLDSWKDWGIHVGKGLQSTFEEWGDKVNYNIEDSVNMRFDDAYEIYTGEVNRQIVSDGIKNLNVEAGGCEFTVKESEDEFFYLDGKELGKLQCYTKEETLYIKSILSSKGGLANLTPSKITLYVPKNISFDNIALELGAGSLKLSKLSTKTASVEVGAGEIVFSGLEAEDVGISVGMGSIEIQELQTDSMNAEVGMGSLTIQGELLSMAKLECSMGSIDLKLKGRETDYNYSFEGALGSVTIGHNEFSGLAQEKSINNHAAKNIDMECAMGNITVKFTE